jgi:hypothetical protein
MIDSQVLKLLHKKINLGGEHVHLFKLVNLVGAGLSPLLIPAVVDAPSGCHQCGFVWWW